MWALRLLALAMLGELVFLRIGLRLAASEWPAAPWQEHYGEIARLGGAALSLGLALFVVFVLRSLIRQDGSRRVRVVTASVLVVLALASVSSAIGPEVIWVDALRHGLAILAIVLIAGDTISAGTTIARAGAGPALLALLFSAVYWVAVTYLPGATNVYWLEVMAEGFGVIAPLVLAAAVQRRTLNDLVALVALAVVGPVAAYLTWSAPAAVTNLVSQALGYRFALPPMAAGVASGAQAYFLFKAWRSTVIPRQAPWSFLLLITSGICMLQPHTQTGTLVAVMIFSWTPPSLLPEELDRAHRLEH